MVFYSVNNILICLLDAVLLIMNNKVCLGVRISQFQCIINLHHSFVCKLTVF